MMHENYTTPALKDKEDIEDRLQRRTALVKAWRDCQEDLPDELQSMYSGKSLGINGETWHKPVVSAVFPRHVTRSL